MSTQQQHHISRGKKFLIIFLFMIKCIHLPEYIVLIPLQKTSTNNIVSIERRNSVDTTDKNILHIGSGPNVDFIIYKNSESGKAYELILVKK
jgi:hypothetical protein